MEFSSSIINGIVLAGDSACIPDKSFNHFITRACEGVLSADKRNAITDDPVFKNIDQSRLKEAYAGIVTLSLEAAKQDAEHAGISHILEDCKFSTERINAFNSIFLAKKSYIQLLLGQVGHSLPHIVDVNWRLDYYIKNNHLEKVSQAVYLIELMAEVPGQAELESIQFSCSLEQLQDLVGKLRDASKSLEKISQI